MVTYLKTTNPSHDPVRSIAVNPFSNLVGEKSQNNQSHSNKSSLQDVSKSNDDSNFVHHSNSKNPTTKNDEILISIIGRNIFKLIRFTEERLKQVGTSKIDAKNYIDQVWMNSERLLICCDQGNIYFVDNGDIREKIDLYQDFKKNFSHMSLSEHELLQSRVCRNGNNGNAWNDREKMWITPTALVRTNAGFCVADANGNSFVYLRDETTANNSGQFSFYFSKLLCLPTISTDVSDFAIEQDFITFMTTSPSNEHFLAFSDHCNLYHYNLNSTNLDNKLIYFKEITAGSHHNKIIDVSTCVRKPLITTVSSDQTLKIWNYKNNSCEISKNFHQDVSCVSLHPNGLHVLVGFADKLRLMNLLLEDLRLFKEFPIRNCRFADFSNGGHLFAATYGTIIMIYSFSNFNLLQSLQAHSQRIIATCWGGSISS